MSQLLVWRRHFLSVLCAIAALAPWPVAAQTAPPQGPPITIGFGMALTGGLAANGRMALLAMQIWEADVNARGGLLGRPVKLVYYDDQSNPPLVPGIYTKLLNVDKVDFIVSGYATNMTAPAVPIAAQYGRLFISLFALDANAEFRYPKYFSMLPTGPNTRPAISEGFFDIVKQQKEKLGLKTIALMVDDGEATRNTADGAHENLKKAGLEIVYDKLYPPTTTDFTPIIRAVQATNPDIVYVSSYPSDSVGIIRAVHELGLKTKIFGGNMTGLQTTSVKQQLGTMLNGTFTFDFWLPAPALQFPGVMAFLKRYQAQAASAGVDPLGYYLAPWAYARMQILGEAIAMTQSLDQDKLAEYIRSHTFDTFVGEVAFGEKGEWTKARVLAVQFQNVKSGELSEFIDGKGEVVLWPPEFKAGEVMAPYSEIPH